MHKLAIQLGHNSTVALYKDGDFLEVVSQEKFDNIKNSSAFPGDAINYMLGKYDLEKKDIKTIIHAGLTVFEHMLLESNEKLSKASFNSKLKEAYGFAEYYFPNKLFNWRFDNKLKKQRNRSHDILKKKLEDFGFEDFELEFVEHHECHAYAPLAIYGDTDDDFLIFTLDGSGDFHSATVSTYKNGKIERIATTSIHDSLGYVYSMTTKFLGMKVLEHEYKVMGLAAYAKEKYFMDTYEKIFKDTIGLSEDGLGFASKFPTRRFYEHLSKVAVGERFDNISGALQYLTEKLVLQWIKNAIKQTGIKNIMTSGGVFMNVKMNQKILNLEEVDKVFFMPSCGDESNVFGAVTSYKKKRSEKKMKRQMDIGLGMEYSEKEILEFLDKNIKGKYSYEKHEDIEKEIATLLTKNKVVARFAGRTEFGARSLGNRAILANPSTMESFYMVNDQIKVRDFWMPFAPSMLDTAAERYLEDYNAERYLPRYMIATYKTKPLFQKECRASMHQGDKTARPQVVTADISPSYYKIIKEFENMTGIGTVLNTSLNIHGYPLVGTLDQALFTFENSGLKYLALENYLIYKK